MKRTSFFLIKNTFGVMIKKNHERTSVASVYMGSLIFKQFFEI